MNIWIASMECAGIAEAGGVKNVTHSLCKEFSALKNQVTLFIPQYKCTDFKNIIDLQSRFIKNKLISICNKKEKVSFSKGFCTDGNFNVVFINHPAFEEKEAVYTYTEHEQAINPEHIKGKGHTDTLFLNALYCKAVVLYGSLLEKDEEIPDYIHCQDASTALIPSFVEELKVYKNTKSLVTIHNAGPAYHHNYANISEAKYYTGLKSEKLCGALNEYKVEPFILAQNAGAALTTVSEEYGNELIDINNCGNTENLSKIFHDRFYTVKGITNGIDFERYNPGDKTVSELPFVYEPEKEDFEGKYLCRKFFLEELIKNPIKDVKIYGTLEENFLNNENIYFSYHGRITTQKGIQVLIDAIPLILSRNDKARFIITGQGETVLEQALINLTNQYKNKILFLNGYEKLAARLTTVAGDFIILPSFFEPCGLEDFIALIYGTLPIAHKTGGLNKIIDEKTGFLYTNNDGYHLAEKVMEVIYLNSENPCKIKEMRVFGAKYVHEKYQWRSVIENEYLPFLKKN